MPVICLSAHSKERQENLKMWLKQNNTPICKGVPLQIGVCIVTCLNYTPIFGIFQGVELNF